MISSDLEKRDTSSQFSGGSHMHARTAGPTAIKFRMVTHMKSVPRGGAQARPDVKDTYAHSSDQWPN